MIKLCHSCGVEYNLSAWSELVLIGRMCDGDDGELELRNCSCRSTIAIEVSASKGDNDEGK